MSRQAAHLSQASATNKPLPRSPRSSSPLDPLSPSEDPDELRAASGSFGLLGVVVSLTLRLDAMGVAELVPVHIPLPLAIPPPKGYTVPKQVATMIEKAKITEAQFEKARDDFIQRCEEDYYLEWFWFRYQESAWVNTWKSACSISVKSRVSD